MTEPEDMTTPPCVSLLELQERVRDLIAGWPGVRNVWIEAELSDFNERGGHCYMSLIQKDPRTGETLANARGTIWRSVWSGVKADFARKGVPLPSSGNTVMVCVSANYHPVYGMSLNISAVNADYALGVRERRRREILERLKKNGIYDLNRELEFPRPLQRIAVISSATAAGYGDFCKQLILNAYGLRFDVRLFPATVQGAQTAPSVIRCLDEIAADADRWDCVCIIRGGGASTDLDGFDDYALASHVAQFPLPVVVGIGHERDTTVLDFIAAKRVKTPTAAAEFLVTRGAGELALLGQIAQGLLQTASDMMSGARQQLAYISGQLPVAPGQAIARADKRLDNLANLLGNIAQRRLQPMGAQLDRMADALSAAATNRLSHASVKLQGYAALIDALSPMATLRRGFSITRVDGAALTDAAAVKPGTTIETVLAQGTLTSITK